MSEANQLSAQDKSGADDIRSDDTGVHWRPHVTSWHPADNWSTQSNSGTGRLVIRAGMFPDLKYSLCLATSCSD